LWDLGLWFELAKWKSMGNIEIWKHWEGNSYWSRFVVCIWTMKVQIIYIFVHHFLHLIIIANIFIKNLDITIYNILFIVCRIAICGYYCIRLAQGKWHKFGAYNIVEKVSIMLL
jgi:hypothetical protein